MKRLSAVSFALLLPACGGGGSPAAPSTPAPTPRPARSVLTLGASNATFTVTSSERVGNLTLKCGDIHVDWIISESAGLPATIVQLDEYLEEADGESDGQRLTALLGFTGRVTSAQPYEFETNRSACGYEGRDLPMVMRVIVDLRDEAGNTHQLTGATGFQER
jgi:hypothetical protein